MSGKVKEWSAHSLEVNREEATTTNSIQREVLFVRRLQRVLVS